ncbi:lipopolysaccharide biosynthesis protein, partial [Thermodesulfobacteriota bacterium]
NARHLWAWFTIRDASDASNSLRMRRMLERKLLSLSRVRLNAIAGYGGQFWTALMGFIFAPLYIKLMGIESYGLVGLCASFMALLFVLDLGLSTTAVRETSRLTALADQHKRLTDLLRTIECIYWIVPCVMGTAVLLSSGWLAGNWLRPDKLTPDQVRQAIIIMAVSMVAHWPSTLYSCALMRLQRHYLVHWVLGTAATIRGIGAVLILWLVSPTIQAFLLWRIAMDLTQTIVFRYMLWKALPRTTEAPRFDLGLIRDIWRFSAQIAGASILLTLITRMDKVIVSRMLTLEYFGYYSFAVMAAEVPMKFASPIQMAVFPRLAELISLGRMEVMEKLYHKASQAIAVLTTPALMLIALFSWYSRGIYSWL